MVSRVSMVSRVGIVSRVGMVGTVFKLYRGKSSYR
jgi:hypothetical protein